MLGCDARSDFIEHLDHLDDRLHGFLGHAKGQVAWDRFFQSRADEAFLDAFLRGAPSQKDIAETLDEDAAAGKLIGQRRHFLCVFIRRFERLGEVMGHQQSEIGVRRGAFAVVIGMAVDVDDAFVILDDDMPAGIGAESADDVASAGLVEELALI